MDELTKGMRYFYTKYYGKPGNYLNFIVLETIDKRYRFVDSSTYSR